MNRSTLLALLLVLVLGVAFRIAPPFAVDGPFVGPSLPEQLPAVLATPAPPVLVGEILVLVTALLLVAWRRSVGQGPLLALVPALVFLFHPAFALSAGSWKGCAELACFAIVVLGAWLMTFGRSSAAVFGAILGFVAVLIAPSGAALAALFAFALAESEPGLPGAAVMATLYGVARAFALPSLLTFLPGEHEWLQPFAATEAPFAVLGPDWWQAIAAVAASIVRPDLAWLASAPLQTVAGLVVLGLLAMGAMFVFAEKRFGGRAAPLLALVAIVLLAFEQHHRGLAVSAALAPVLLLVALWIATVADVVDGHRVRRGFAVSACCVALAFVAWGRVNIASSIRTAGTALRAAALPFPAESTLAALAARVEATGRGRDDAVIAAKESLAGAQPSTPIDLERDRDLAIAAALAGDSHLASQLLQRALAHASAEATVDERRRIELDLLDLLLRARRGDDVVKECDEKLGLVSDPKHRAQLLVRKASGHVQRLVASAGVRAAEEVEWSAARKALDDAVEADGVLARAHFDRGRLAIVRGNGVLAVRDLEVAALLAPRSPHPHLQLALFYLSRAQESPALDHFEAARAIGGAADPEVRLFTAQRMVSRGDTAGAERLARELESEAPRLLGGDAAIADLHTFISVAAEAAHDGVLALRAARAAFERVDDRGGAITQRFARLLAENQSYEELVSLLESLRSKHAPYPDLEDSLAGAWKNCGIRQLAIDRGKARECFVSAIRESANYRDLGTAPMLLRTITLEMKLPDDALVHEAKRAYDRGVAAAPVDPELAERALEVSRGLLPGNPYATYQLGRLKKKKGAKDEASALFDEALRDAGAIGSKELAALVAQEIESP